ncbi:rod shape-determining protein MreC [Desulfurivibrio alkaliphilus]|uniref:Cell shape-determining protein MreC n=1 Tax=Desulfurivibrio alkaliphilus (strain DSM 19089 / UNIQEM U267 / AHT2) TaxID=589865 RepID=D6Z4Y9_DESAT|nr:rod shape-determining protein MreC [Desulfurivibrio alkaliphilus]ADH86614.1 rod shape-determining protein MreC [Desulfurivibrio alkaliphilus AHT 2]
MISYKKKGKRARQARNLLVFGFIAALLVIIIVASLGRKEFNVFHKLGLEVVGVAQAVSTGISGYFGGIWSDYRELINVREENRRLREELRQHKAATSQYREAVATNVRLKKLLELRESLPDPTITARVIGRDSSLWFKTITIDRGSSDGIERGMPVVTVEGVVGQVINTSPNYAKVLLANDPNSAIDVIVQKNRVQGIIKGDGDGFTLHYVLRTSDVAPGDHVITSGLGGVFPKGLPVGQVSEVIRARRGMFQTIQVEPAADFSRLEHLIIIMKKSSLAE